jgi:hypothetical protein
MRILLVLTILTFSLFLRGQTQNRSVEDSSHSIRSTQSRKWFLTSYSSVGIGFNFFNGNAATLVSAPIGLQLNRRLNNNFYAFAGVSAAPGYVNFNRSFLSPGIIKTYTGNNLKSAYFGLAPSANLGLMYINDARTFSVSGSIGVERGRYPMLLYPPGNVQRINTFTPAYR